MVHKSRLSSYYRTNKLRDLTNLISELGLKVEDYVGDNWASGEFDGKMYGITYDILPIVLFYNRNLIPAGYTEADILADDFTLDKMLEMMKAAYKDAPMANKKIYGMAFNYGYTENMFISFLNQQGAHIVDPANPTTPTYANAAGYAAAEAVRSIPFTKTEAGLKTSSESGTDHLNVFVQGRALFTIDGIWSAPDACTKDHLDKLNAGVALLPKINAEASRSVFADGHSFVMFNTNKSNSDKDLAVSVFLEYLIENSSYWCQGGKIASRSDVLQNEDYQKLEWAYLSNKLSSFVSPDKVYSFDTLSNPIGKYVAELCEGTMTDVEAAINQAAQDGRQAAEQI
jgi:multiple sugar transport system substrate-binding protein